MVLYQRGILSLGSEVLCSDTGVLTRTCGSKTLPSLLVAIAAHSSINMEA